MDLTVQLTKREMEVAECLAWGASKKEVPDLLMSKPGKSPISVRTVEVITKSIYSKLRIQKVSELAVWYFCKNYNISLDLSPLRRQIVSAILLAFVICAEVSNNNDFLRPSSGRVMRTIVRAGKQARKEGRTFDLISL